MKIPELDAWREEQNEKLLAEIDAELRAAAANIPNIERRFLSAEIRAEDHGDKKILKGYAAKFNRLSQNLGGFKERLAPACFSRSLRRNPNVALLANHDSGAILARCSANNLEVAEDAVGLRFKATLPGTTLADDTFENIRSGNITGMSFSMRVKSDQWDEVDDDDESDDDDDPKRGGRIARRTVIECDISEISAVTFPAYLDTDVTAAARALWPAGMPAEIRSRIQHIQRSEQNQDDELRARLKRAGEVFANEVSEEELNFRMKLKVRAAGLLLDS